MSNNTKTIKNNSITGKKRKKIKTEILENDGNKFSVDKQSLSINIQRIFVNSWETKLKLFDIGKQIIINYCDESSQLQDLLSYFYQYMTILLIS